MTKAIPIGVLLSLGLTAGCERSVWSDRQISATAAAAATQGTAAVAAVHPLDPLTPDEIRTAVQAARADDRLGTAAFPSIDASGAAEGGRCWRGSRVVPLPDRHVCKR